jgi:hypothetical protein
LIFVLVIIAAAGDAAAAAQQQSGTTAFLSQPLRGNTTTLAAALEDQRVTRIVLVSNYTVDKDGWARQQQRTGTYLPINRLVSGAAAVPAAVHTTTVTAPAGWLRELVQRLPCVCFSYSSQELLRAAVYGLDVSYNAAPLSLLFAGRGAAAAAAASPRSYEEAACAMLAAGKMSVCTCQWYCAHIAVIISRNSTRSTAVATFTLVMDPLPQSNMFKYLSLGLGTNA